MDDLARSLTSSSQRDYEITNLLHQTRYANGTNDAIVHTVCGLAWHRPDFCVCASAFTISLHLLEIHLALMRVFLRAFCMLLPGRFGIPKVDPGFLANVLAT